MIAVYHRQLADAMQEEISIGKGSVFSLLNRIGYGVYESAAPEESLMNINTVDAFGEMRKKICRFL